VVSLSASVLSQRAAFAVGGAAWNPIVVDQLRREKLVRCSTPSADGLIEPYHARVRESALTAMSADRRRELHLKIGAYLETRGRAEPEALAHHYRHAGQNALALRWTRSAARAARDAFAFTRAAELLRDAALLADDDRERIGLLGELGEARVQAGHRADAGRAYLTAAVIAADLGDEAQVSALRTTAGEHFLLAGHIKRGIDLLREALAAVGVTLPGDAATAVAATINVGAALASRGLAFTARAHDAVPPRDLRRLDLELAVGHALALSDVRASWITSQALLDALEVGEPRRVQRAMAYFAFSNCAREPDHPLVAECIGRARQLADELDDDYGRAWVSLTTGFWRAQRAEFPAAITDLDDAQRRFLVHGAAHAREAAMANIALLVLRGNYGIDIPAAQRDGARCLEDALERDDLFAANWARAQFAWHALAADDVAAARDNLGLALRSWPGANEELFATTALVSEIAIELYAAPATAWDVIEARRSGFEQLYASLIPATRGVFHRLRAASALAALLAGRASAEETARRIDQSVEIVRRWAYGGPMSRAVEGFACAARGDHDGYARLLRAAEDGWRRQAQRGPTLTARLRLCQLAGDEPGARAAADELRAFGVAEPDRYALLFAGPRVTPRPAAG
jgi:hypothetical protein